MSDDFEQVRKHLGGHPGSCGDDEDTLREHDNALAALERIQAENERLRKDAHERAQAAMLLLPPALRARDLAVAKAVLEAAWKAAWMVGGQERSLYTNPIRALDLDSILAGVGE